MTQTRVMLVLLVGLAACSSPPAPPAAVEGSIVGVVFSPGDTPLESLFGSARGGDEVFAIPEDEMLAFLAEADGLERIPTLGELTDGSESFLHLRAGIDEHDGVTTEVDSDGTFQVEAPGDGRVAVCLNRANPGAVEISVPGCRLVDPREAPRLQTS